MVLLIYLFKTPGKINKLTVKGLRNDSSINWSPAIKLPAEHESL